MSSYEHSKTFANRCVQAKVKTITVAHRQIVIVIVLSAPNSDPDLVAKQFEEFYEAYPRRQAKEDAEAAWRKLNPNEQLFSRILADIRSRFRAIDVNFVPLPAKYLNGARWNDEIIAIKRETKPRLTYRSD